MMNTKNIIFNALCELYVNPLTHAINEGYMQHISSRRGICQYAESHIRNKYKIDIIVKMDIVEEWLRTYNTSIEKVMRTGKEHELMSENIRK